MTKSLTVERVTIARRVNLDTIGRMGALAFQYAAVLAETDALPKGEGLAIVRNGARHDVDGDEAGDDLRSDIMDQLTELLRAGGQVAFDGLAVSLAAMAREWAEADGREFAYAPEPPTRPPGSSPRLHLVPPE